VSLTGGQVHDLVAAPGLLAQVTPQALIGDKAFDSDGFIGALAAAGITPIIPPKANRRSPRPCDFALYAERNLIERFFNKLKQFRGIATRYEKLARNFLAAVRLVAILTWLN